MSGPIASEDRIWGSKVFRVQDQILERSTLRDKTAYAQKFILVMRHGEFVPLCSIYEITAVL